MSCWGLGGELKGVLFGPPPIPLSPLWGPISPHGPRRKLRPQDYQVPLHFIIKQRLDGGIKMSHTILF